MSKVAEEHMPTPESLHDVGDIPNLLTTTHEGELFLHFESSAHDKGRILIFATSCNLELLEDCKNGIVIPRFNLARCFFIKFIQDTGKLFKEKSSSYS